jgi:hypothetical protein
MNLVILIVMAVLTMTSGAQAKNNVYGVNRSSLESEGYKLFVSDKILDTVARIANDSGSSVGYCNTVDKNTAESLGDISTLRSDTRVSIPVTAKPSYFAACTTYNSVVERLKSADDIRKLWLLFGDSATDDYVVETLKNWGKSEEINGEIRLLIEMKRLAIVSKYIEFFTKNKEWKITDYTFLSQAYKSRKGKTLSPAYSQFIEALLTGDREKALQVLNSIDLENLGIRFMVPDMSDHKKIRIYNP